MPLSVHIYTVMNSFHVAPHAFANFIDVLPHSLSEALPFSVTLLADICRHHNQFDVHVMVRVHLLGVLNVQLTSTHDDGLLLSVHDTVIRLRHDCNQEV